MRSSYKGLLSFFLIFSVLGLDATLIDTTITGSQTFRSYVFPSQYTYNNGDIFIGDIEFRGGLLNSQTDLLVSVSLSVTPPLNGPISLTGDSGGGFNPAAQFYIMSDLTLGNIYFVNTFSNNNYWVVRPNVTIFMTKDILLDNPGPSLTLLPSSQLTYILTDTGRVFDGQGHRLILTDVNHAYFDPTSITLRNLIIEGATADNFGNQTGTITAMFWDDVTVAASEGQTLTFAGSNVFGGGTNLASLNFRGTNNVLGYGATFDLRSIFVYAPPFQDFLQIYSLSRLTITPNTTLWLGNMQFGTSPPNDFRQYVLFEDNTAELLLDNCNLKIGSGIAGDTVIFLSGTVYINGTVRIQAGSTGAQLMIGDGVSAVNNCNFIILPGSKLLIDEGMTLINKNV